MSLSVIDTALIQEIERRDMINNIIDFLLSKAFQFTDNKFHKLKRGEVHNYIASEMKVTLNNTLCNTIGDRIALQGGIPRKVSGTLYYLHMKKANALGM